jgi:Restriction endonuclease
LRAEFSLLAFACGGVEFRPMSLRRIFRAGAAQPYCSWLIGTLGEVMSGQGWSCFAQLPPGLIDGRSATLTLNWLRPKPTLAGFKLKPSDINVERYYRSVRIRRQSLFAGAFAVAVSVLAVAADLMFSLGLLGDETTMFAGVWVATSTLFLAAFLYFFATYSVMSFQRAEPRRIAYGAACMEFEEIDAWRRVRCDPAFWRDHVDDAGFEMEAAELLAGHLRTGQVMLTRPTDDYGVDVLLCSPLGRTVAQCKQWKGVKTGAAQVRALAGAQAFFDADHAMLISLDLPASEREQCEAFVAKQNLEVWNVDTIVTVAARLRAGGTLIA